MSVHFVVSGPFKTRDDAERELGDLLGAGHLSPLDHPCVVFFGRRWYVMTPD